MSSKARIRGFRRAAALLAAVSFVVSLLVGSAGASTKTDLAAAKAKLDKLLGQIASEQKAIDGLEADVSAVAAKIDAVQSKMAKTQAQIVQTQHEIQEANDNIAATQGQLDERARVAYESGPGSTFEFLLGSTSISDFSDRLEIINHAAQSDQDLINQMQDQRAKLATQKIKLQSYQEQLAAQQADLNAQQNDLETKLSAAKSAVEKLNADKEDAAKQVSQLKDKLAKEEEAARLAQLQQSQNGQTVNGHPFGLCPVDQPRGYSDSFGAPRYGGGYHLHAGVDIFAPRGTPIRATFSGTASDVSNALGGLSVDVTGADGWTYNAHMDSIGQLGPVSQGTIIGYVGNTGDAQGGPTHNHFEWHPNVFPNPLYRSVYGITSVGSAIDPFPYLNQVC